MFKSKFQSEACRHDYLNKVADFAHREQVTLCQAWQEIDGGQVLTSYTAFRTMRSRHARPQVRRDDKIFRLSDLLDSED